MTPSPPPEDSGAMPPAAFDPLLARGVGACEWFPGVTVPGHPEVVEILSCPRRFSNQVSAHLSVPNGMDPPEHTPFRALIEPYFAPDVLRRFDPQCVAIVRHLLDGLEPGGPVEVVSGVARPFAVGMQCAFLGWPETLRDALWDWWMDHQEAVARRDKPALVDNARHFERVVLDLLAARRPSDPSDIQDLTGGLLNERVEGRPLTDPEIVSILRNWTAGEVGTLSASVAILLAWLSTHPDVQERLRRLPEELEPAIDEILRIHAPLASNRRITTCPVRIGGQSLPAGTRLNLVWASANRDPRVFGDPDRFDPGTHAPHNLVWGRGVHVCPGAPLARLELRRLLEGVLSRYRLEPAAEPPVPAPPPGTGYEALPIVFMRSPGQDRPATDDAAP